MRQAIVSILAMTGLLGGCAVSDLVLEPSSVVFPVGQSVRQSVEQQALPAQTDPLAIVEGLDGEFAGHAMQAYKASAKVKEDSGGDQPEARCAAARRAAAR